ncbi:MAG: hypothetical protein COU71_02005 [Parcubacteria group bacterium CG10_big_fil_rev_8_21_14_0_10_38_31]|nr:MAG: hypothetical protein COU71_02005 [Parcubacteria group bacterium CG10_big_fil_rev_8_21_14_0_10_38_31]
MEDLTKSQLILLALLVSFVTSIATGIVTVSLVNQAPPQVTQMVGRVIEKTVEVVSPSDSDIASVVETIIVSDEEMTVKAVEKVIPTVVSVVVTKDVPVLEQYFVNPFQDDPLLRDFSLNVPQYRQKGTEEKKVSSGTGFIISDQGMIVTNKHVVADEKANYSVILNDGQKFDVEIIARDLMQDIAILKIKKEENEESKTFKYASLGNSDNIKIGQKVIAIGNALGELQNTVSVGIVSGLNREIVASGAMGEERLFEVIQTDAAINLGNSGGPLLDLRGKIVGINVAKSSSGENIGFSLPVNIIKKIILDIEEFGEIKYAMLGVRYITIDNQISKEKNLSVDYGAMLVSDKENNAEAVFKDSPADKAGLKEGDIVLEFNGEKITSKKTLSLFISKSRVNDEVILKVLRGEENLDIKVTMGEQPK